MAMLGKVVYEEQESFFVDFLEVSKTSVPSNVEG